ncbi:SIS domain-containing protein [Microbacterium sp. BK668]|uniref:D-sedoheptulose-7-phosphate isomerase n=1 Tax=Microbacterium sp. BK668 TaxID=2512118 RepID=UPI00105B525A|nr:SIS domain-containing protein [Microbacterium sp. BK668]TDN90691.1 phosphoheptose isomerase [Microbacterium sp. BK668]
MTTTIPARTATAERSAAILNDHLASHLDAVEGLTREVPRLVAWGTDLADRLLRGRRLLAMGNGGSAAEAQHLTAEIVGRFDGERPPFSAIALHADTSSVTAIANDYGYDEVFARQVRAHGRAGDVVVLLSTSGRSPNLLAAVQAARTVGATTWALCGDRPNPLASAVDEALCLPGTSAAVQETHLLALHLLCRVFDERVRSRLGAGGER